MNRKDRRESILEAAAELALTVGLNTLTIRSVALHAGIALGQIHHHFASSGQMKSEVLVHLMHDMLARLSEDTSGAWIDILIRYLKSDDGNLEAYSRVWREAQVIAGSNENVKIAYLEVMKVWNDSTKVLIERACENGEATISDSCEETAWRLSSFVCGLDGSCALGLISIADAHRYIERMVRFELNII